MANVPYPITGETLEDVRKQLWEVLREVFEDRIGGLYIGDVFQDGGDVLTLRLGTNPCLDKSASSLQVQVKDTAGLQKTADGLSTKLKTSGGLSVDANGLYVDGLFYGFGVVDCPSGTDPAAGSGNSTLALTAGTGITITGDSSTDTVNFSLDASSTPSFAGIHVTETQTDHITEHSNGHGVNIDKNVTIGTGAGGVDYSLAFDGETNDGVITWMEDEDYFKFDDDIHMGDATNKFNISDTDGQITWDGTFDKKLTLRPGLVDHRTKINDDKPTEVTRGCNIGYSFPVYNSDGEELYWRMRIPNRWCGDENPQFGICVTLAAGEDVGDKFKFQLEWQTSKKGNVMGTTTSNVVSEQTVLTGRNDAYDTYFIFFNLTYNDVTNPIEHGSMLQGRLRRIAASSNTITGEVIVWDWATMWSVDKAYSNWSIETNDT